MSDPTGPVKNISAKDSPSKIAIVGGGIVGLASAYYLARRGANVTVFEQGTIGNGSTSLAAGGIRTQFNRQADIQMMIESVDLWEQFNESFDTDIRYCQAGYLLGIQDPDQLAAMKDVLALQREQGLNNRLLTPEEATKHCPGLISDRFEAVAYGPTDGYFDPHSALMGFKEAAEDVGVTIRTNCAVTDLIQYANGRVVGVSTEDGKARADAVINAGGAWAPALAAKAGLSLSIEPKARRAAMAEPSKMPSRDIPLVVDFGSGVYFRPFDDQQMLVGGHFEAIDSLTDSDSTDARVKPAPKPDIEAPLDWKQETLERAADCSSYFDPDSKIVDSWEGRYGMTPDENPIIEKSLPGLFTAAGFSGHGLMMAPATGQLVADLVLEGDSSLVNTAVYSSTRFDEGKESREEAAAIDQF